MIDRAVAAAPTDALAATHRAVLLVLTDDEQAALPALAAAAELAAGRDDLIAFGTSYAGLARVQLGDLSGLDLLRDGIEQATAAGQRDYLARSYTSIVRALERIGRYDELAHYVDEGLSRRARGRVPFHAYTLEAHRSLLPDDPRGVGDRRAGAARARRGAPGRRVCWPGTRCRCSPGSWCAVAPTTPTSGWSVRGSWLDAPTCSPSSRPPRWPPSSTPGSPGDPSWPTSPSDCSASGCTGPAWSATAVSCCATCDGWGGPPSRSTATPRSSPRACAATGGPRPPRAAVDPYAQALELAESPDPDTVLAALTLPRRARRRARGHPRAAAAAGAGGAADPPRTDARNAGSPTGLTERQLDVLGPARRGALQPRDRRTAGPLGAHGGPPRVGDPRQARRQLPARGRGPARAVNRPHVLLSVATSLDGHIDDASTERLILSGAEDLDRVDAERAAVDAILVGAATIAADDPRLLVRSADPARRAVHRGCTSCRRSRSRSPAAAAASTRAPSSSPRATAEKLVCAPSPARPRPVPLPRRRACRPRAATPPGRARHRVVAPDLARRARRPRRRGGSPGSWSRAAPTTTAFLTAGLVDELQVVVAPLVVGDPAARAWPPPRWTGWSWSTCAGSATARCSSTTPAGPDQRHRSRDSPS